MAHLILDDLNGLSEQLQAEYEKKDDGKYHLKVEGELPEVKELKAKLTEFRDNNIKYMKERDALDEKLKSFAGVDPEEYKKTKARIEELERSGVKDTGDFEIKMQEAVKAQVEPLHRQLAEMQQDKEKATLALKTRDLEASLRSVATKVGVAESAVDDFVSRGARVYNLDGKPVKGDETIWSEKNPAEPMPMTEWAEKLAGEAPHLFKKNSGGGSGGERGGGGAAGRIANDPISIGDNLEAIAKGEVKVNFEGQ
jgi:hypothetical protein